MLNNTSPYIVFLDTYYQTCKALYDSITLKSSAGSTFHYFRMIWYYAICWWFEVFGAVYNSISNLLSVYFSDIVQSVWRSLIRAIYFEAVSTSCKILPLFTHRHTDKSTFCAKQTLKRSALSSNIFLAVFLAFLVLKLPAKFHTDKFPSVQKTNTERV